MAIFCSAGLHAIEIAGDELQLRVAERRAAPVVERHPAVEVAGLVVAADRQHVVGVPRAARWPDTTPRRGAAAPPRFEQLPDQRGPAEEVRRQLREPHVVGAHARSRYSLPIFQMGALL